MKRGYIAKWENIEDCKNLLFFAQTVDELTFDYSIASHRLPTLNSHYLCLDAMSTINDIDNHGVPEGTLRPIFEELYYSLENDPLFPETDSPLKYCLKESQGKHDRVYNPRDLNYEERKDIIQVIHERVFKNNAYFDRLKGTIIELVKSKKEEEQSTLFTLTKALITELVNAGYDQRYIRIKLIYCFFNIKTTVCICDHIDTFFSAFPFTKKKFEVVLIADSRLQDTLQNTDDVKTENQYTPKTRITEEREFLQGKAESERFFIVEVDQEMDPYSAAETVEFIINFRISFYILYDHAFDALSKSTKFIVYDEANYYTIVPQKKSAVHRMKTPSVEIIIHKLGKINEALRKNEKNGVILFLASNLHSLSLKSNAEENQILDLWAIIECIFNIRQGHTSDRITQICSNLVPIINCNYLYSLFNQLLLDIRNYDEDRIQQIIGDEENEFKRVLMLAQYILLEAHRDKCDRWIDQCGDFPLLKFRILKYREVFNNRGTLADFLKTHSQRITWQIMRAYRNRNLIIHNGETMPYTALLVENLHAYVDDLLDYIIMAFANDYSINSIRLELFAQECEWNEKTEKNNASKLIDEEFLEYALSANKFRKI